MGLLDRLDTDPDRHEKDSQRREAAFERHNSRRENTTRRARERGIDAIRFAGGGFVKLVVWPFKAVLGLGKRIVIRDDADDTYDVDVDFGIGLLGGDDDDSERWSR